VLEEYGFDHIAGFLISGRHMEHLIDLLFDRTDPVELKQAHDCFTKLVKTFADAGYGVYRTSPPFMKQAAQSYGPAQAELNKRLNLALDPNGILAPGKSGIS
jgi:4-cresol dehydrogenase (hydroxylating)